MPPVEDLGSILNFVIAVARVAETNRAIESATHG